MSRVGFICHPLDMNQYRSYIRHLRPDKEYNDKLLLKLFEWAPPYKVKDYTGISLDGKRFTDASFFMVPFLPEMRDIKLKRVIEKVEGALLLASEQGCTVAALGAFTSIVLQGREQELEGRFGLRITSGNTFTAAVIIRSIEKICESQGIDLSQTTLGIVGASGDIGSGCVAWFGDKVKNMVLSARSMGPLNELLARHRASITAGIELTADNRNVIDKARIIIFVTSSHSHLFTTADFRPGTIVCDASAPLNVCPDKKNRDVTIFHGGIVTLPIDLNPGFDIGLANPCDFYGCQTEGILMALNENLPSSWGRGNITREKLAAYLVEMYNYPQITIAASVENSVVSAV